MERQDIIIFTALVLSIISILFNVHCVINHQYIGKKSIHGHYDVRVDAPTINIWKETDDEDDEYDQDREFSLSYDTIDNEIIDIVKNP